MAQNTCKCRNTCSCPNSDCQPGAPPAAAPAALPPASQALGHRHQAALGPWPTVTHKGDFGVQTQPCREHGAEHLLPVAPALLLFAHSCMAGMRELSITAEGRGGRRKYRIITGESGQSPPGERGHFGRHGTRQRHRPAQPCVWGQLVFHELHHS